MRLCWIAFWHELPDCDIHAILNKHYILTLQYSFFRNQNQNFKYNNKLLLYFINMKNSNFCNFYLPRMLIFFKFTTANRYYQCSALNVGPAGDLYECHTGSKRQNSPGILRWQWITESRQFRGNSYGPTCCGGGRWGRVPRVGRSDSHKKCSQWDDKSNFRFGCTKPWPIVAFYMQSRVKLWRGGKEATVAADSAARVGPLCYLLTGSIIVLLLPWER